MMRTRKTECACSRCQEACEHTPGWFRPGEAEKAAKLLGLSLKAMFRRYLGVNWWCDSAKGDVFVLAPAIRGRKAGREYPGDPRGRCVFFTKDRRCMIHKAKPFDCSHGNPCQLDDKAREVHQIERGVTVAMWRGKQSQIVQLLGREPIADENFNPWMFF